MSEKAIEVKDLTISFKTDNGIVRAVRGVSFDLYKGETLCIVGESGSGKSVTSKAIMGILSNNAIVEKGSIMYEGENLLEVSEEEFHKIRGHKIGMIFQDPLSSLNPIVRIGKQIVEATLVNADNLKRMYNELISEELTQYKNTLAKKRISICNYNNELDRMRSEYKKKIHSETITDEEKNQLKSALNLKKAEVSAATRQIKAETAVVAKEQKQALIAKKKEAKIKVAEYKMQITEEHQKKLAELNSEMAQIKQEYAGMNTNSSDTKALKEKYDAKIKACQEKIDQEKSAYVSKLRITKREAKERALKIMKEVGIPLPEKRFKQYPFEFSGGMRQRIVIAIALTINPEILICDEPTTALDVTIQGQILELIKKIQEERHISCIFITHDLGVVANMADRVAVMYAGKIVEYGTADDIFFEPKHPYTWALLSSIPDVDSKERLEAIPGTPPNMIYPPKGDAFALRSKYAMKIDFEHEPPFYKVSDTHYAATWLLHPDAPKVEMPKIVSERISNSLKLKASLESKKGETLNEQSK